MKNKRSLKIMILAALAAVATLLCSSCGKTNYTGRTKIFEKGQHSIAVSLGPKLETKNVEIEAHPGYEATSVGIDNFHWVVLYTNTERVECAGTDRGFSEFGIPVEQDMKLVREE